MLTKVSANTATDDAQQAQRGKFGKTVWSCTLDISIAVLQSCGTLSTAIFAALKFVDDFSEPMKRALETIYLPNPQRLDLQHLSMARKTTRLFCELSRHYDSWRRQKSHLARAYTALVLPLLRQIADILVHQNRFQTAAGDLKDTPDETTLRVYLFDIVRYVLVAIFTFTDARQPLQTTPDEWDFSNLIFSPVLDMTDHNRRVGLGALSSLLALYRDVVLSPTPVLSKQVLSDSIELGFAVFVSQLAYAIHTPVFELQYREQFAIEIGGELSAALDAFNKTFLGAHAAAKGLESASKMVARLQSYVAERLQ